MIRNSVVFFPCSDIEKTSQFYQTVCGFPKVQEQKSGKLHIFDTGYGYLGFCQYDDARPVPSGPVGICISLNCRDKADVDAYYTSFKERGVPILGAPEYDDVFPVYSFLISDPDGYKVEFQHILLEDQKLTGGRVRA